MSGESLTAPQTRENLPSGILTQLENGHLDLLQSINLMGVEHMNFPVPEMASYAGIVRSDGSDGIGNAGVPRMRITEDGNFLMTPKRSEFSRVSAAENRDAIRMIDPARKKLAKYNALGSSITCRRSDFGTQIERMFNVMRFGLYPVIDMNSGSPVENFASGQIHYGEFGAGQYAQDAGTWFTGYAAVFINPRYWDRDSELSPGLLFNGWEKVNDTLFVDLPNRARMIPPNRLGYVCLTEEEAVFLRKQTKKHLVCDEHFVYPRIISCEEILKKW